MNVNDVDDCAAGLAQAQGPDTLGLWFDEDLTVNALDAPPATVFMAYLVLHEPSVDAIVGVEYRFDWGDGTMSDWAGASVVGHAWTTAGTYDVAAQARCQDHPEVESVWSLVLTVTILAAETVSTPDPPAGATTTEIQVSQTYDLSGAVSSAMEDRVDPESLPLRSDRDELGELARNNEKLLRAVADYSQYLQTLAGKLSHELQTPLAITRSSLDNLSNQNLDPDSRRFLERAREGVDRQTAIVRAMSEASRPEASSASK